MQAEWSTMAFEGAEILILAFPGEPYFALPANGKKSASRFIVADRRKLGTEESVICYLRKGEVHHWLANARKARLAEIAESAERTARQCEPRHAWRNIPAPRIFDRGLFESSIADAIEGAAEILAAIPSGHLLRTPRVYSALADICEPRDIPAIRAAIRKAREFESRIACLPL